MMRAGHGIVRLILLVVAPGHSMMHTVMARRLMLILEMFCSTLMMQQMIIILR